jgi:hypothetical protein
MMIIVEPADRKRRGKYLGLDDLEWSTSPDRKDCGEEMEVQKQLIKCPVKGAGRDEEKVFAKGTKVKKTQVKIQQFLVSQK